MTKQTNEFQQLVLIIQRILAPKGAFIKESAEVGPDKREIDVLIQANIGLYKIKVAVEAKDESRPMSIDRMEGYVAKYRPDGELGVNKVVIVSRRGFSKKARKLGERVGFELLTLDEAKDTEYWEKQAQFQSDSKLFFSLPAHFHQIKILPFNDEINDSLVRGGILKCDKCSKSHGTVLEKITRFSQQELSKPELKLRVKEELAEHNGHVLLTFRAPFRNLWIEYEGSRHDFDELVWEIHISGEEVPLDVKLYEQVDCDNNKLGFSVAKATALGKELSIVIPVTDDTPESISLNIKSVDTKNAAAGGRRVPVD